MPDYMHRMPEDEGREEYALTLGNLPKILRASWRDYADITMFFRVPLMLGMTLMASGARSRSISQIAPYVEFLCAAVFFSFLAFLVLRCRIRVDDWSFIPQLALSLLYGLLMFMLTYFFYGFVVGPPVLFIFTMSAVGLMMLLRME